MPHELHEFMKPLTTVTYGIIATLIAGFAVNSVAAGAEESVLRVLDHAQGLPYQAQLSDEEKTAQLTRLKAQAKAEKNRALWISQWETARKSLKLDEKTERKMGSPKAFGKRAKKQEARALALENKDKLKMDRLEKLILGSMQSSLARKENLNDSEIKWLESLVVDAPPIDDEVTILRAKMIMELEKSLRGKPHDGVEGKPVPVKPTPVKPVPILVE